MPGRTLAFWAGGLKISSGLRPGTIDVLTEAGRSFQNRSAGLPLQLRSQRNDLPDPRIARKVFLERRENAQSQRAASGGAGELRQSQRVICAAEGQHRRAFHEAARQVDGCPGLAALQQLLQ